MLPRNIKQRKQIHNGFSQRQWKLYQPRANEKQIGRINDKSLLPSAVEPTYCNRNSETKDTHMDNKVSEEYKRKYKRIA